MLQGVPARVECRDERWGVRVDAVFYDLVLLWLPSRRGEALRFRVQGLWFGIEVYVVFCDNVVLQRLSD